MQKHIVLLSVVAGNAILFGAARPTTAESSRRAETNRLQSHFDSVDTELKTRSTSGLSNTQKARRAELIGWLREYRNTAAFPVNDRFHVATPFFRDSQGNLCAMAYLIARSGRRDIVEAVAGTNNNAYIRELVQDAKLLAWLDSAGLSVAEAARIQPAYNGPYFYDDPNKVRSDFAIAAVGLGSASLASAALSIARPGYAAGIASLLMGATAGVVGVNHMDGNRGTKRVGTMTAEIGAVGIVAGVYSILKTRATNGAGRSPGTRSPESSPVVSAVTIAPGSMRIGLVANRKF